MADIAKCVYTGASLRQHGCAVPGKTQAHMSRELCQFRENLTLFP